jgi:hypothetical protein
MSRMDDLFDEALDKVQGLLDHLRSDPSTCGCDVDRDSDPTSDADIDAVVLFAGVDAENVATHAQAWRELGGTNAP